MAFTDRPRSRGQEAQDSGVSVGKNFTESVGKSVISVFKGTKKATPFMAVKKTVRKLPGLVI